MTWRAAVTGICATAIMAPTACDRQHAGSATPGQGTAASLQASLLNNLDARRARRIHTVKIDLNSPPVTTTLDPGDGRRVAVHAWPHNHNDFNVAMMRIDSGPTLYEITEDEFNALRMSAGSR